jgi:hypothetical protein
MTDPPHTPHDSRHGSDSPWWQLSGTNSIQLHFIIAVGSFTTTNTNDARYDGELRG